MPYLCGSLDFFYVTTVKDGIILHFLLPFKNFRILEDSFNDILSIIIINIRYEL